MHTPLSSRSIVDNLIAVAQVGGSTKRPEHEFGVAFQTTETITRELDYALNESRALVRIGMIEAEPTSIVVGGLRVEMGQTDEDSNNGLVVTTVVKVPAPYKDRKYRRIPRSGEAVCPTATRSAVLATATGAALGQFPKNRIANESPILTADFGRNLRSAIILPNHRTRTPIDQTVFDNTENFLACVHYRTDTAI